MRGYELLLKDYIWKAKALWGRAFWVAAHSSEVPWRGCRGGLRMEAGVYMR